MTHYYFTHITSILIIISLLICYKHYADNKNTSNVGKIMITDTLWWTNIAMENHHFWWENPLHMAIFNCYVSSPEGNSITILICLAPSIRLWERIGGARMMLRQVRMIRPALHNSWGVSIDVALKLDGLWKPKNHGKWMICHWNAWYAIRMHDI